MPKQNLCTEYNSPLYCGLRYVFKVWHAADREDLPHATVVGIFVQVGLRQKAVVISISALITELSVIHISKLVFEENYKERKYFRWKVEITQP